MLRFSKDEELNQDVGLEADFSELIYFFFRIGLDFRTFKLKTIFSNSLGKFVEFVVGRF